MGTTKLRPLPAQIPITHHIVEDPILRTVEDPVTPPSHRSVSHLRPASMLRPPPKFRATPPPLPPGKSGLNNLHRSVKNVLRNGSTPNNLPSPRENDFSKVMKVVFDLHDENGICNGDDDRGLIEIRFVLSNIAVPDLIICVYNFLKLI